MDDLAGKLGEILNSPEGMKQVQELAGMLGINSAAPAEPVPAVPAAAGLAGISPDMVGAMMQLAPMLSRMQEDDDTTRLLQALRPLLSAERRPKIDRAIQMVRMIHLLPMLQESGVFSSLLRLL